MTSKTTVVLVHGALTDASVWQHVSLSLQREGHPVLALAMPMRSLAADIQYLSSFLATIEGPVLLAGHSYGGTVISAPEFAIPSVKGLIYIAAFAPDAGESTGELNGRWPGSLLAPEAILLRPCATGQDLYLKLESFGNVYAHDLPEDTVRIMAAAQRPIEASALAESFSGEPSWRTKPNWMLVTAADRSLPPAAQRFMASRMGATVSEVNASHAVPVARPEEVTGILLNALRASA